MKNAARIKESHQKDESYKAKSRERSRKYRDLHPDRVRLTRWERAGIKIDATAYRTMWDEQKGRCKICGRHESELIKRLSMDHDHKTGKARGLLCDRCNRILLPAVERYGHLIYVAQGYLSDGSGTKAMESRPIGIPGIC